MIKRLLIANRGAIACRIARTAKEMEIETVAVFSQGDAGRLHMRVCDLAEALVGYTAHETYLSIDALLAAAARSGADAVHPGYGFLSENADFAAAVTKAGLIFVGPDAKVIAQMGRKDRAKGLAAAAGLTLIPGYDGAEQALEQLYEQGVAIGFPLLVKASAGGGGKGMRLVNEEGALKGALEDAKAEALAAFGDGHVMLERYMQAPRHIEVQLAADSQGQVVHLGTRDCSLQRRHQKIMEEAPAPDLDDALRAQMQMGAVTLARHIGYTSVGTVEFLVAEGQAYFMEMNTRIQVEHGVTEEVYNLDLVEWQLRIAAGESLPLAQADLSPQGHALEARIYAEDPENDFLPSGGRLEVLAWPTDEKGLRLESAAEQGDAIDLSFDPMLAKVIVHGDDRSTAWTGLARALAGLRLAGAVTNVSFLSAVLKAGETVFDTATIARRHDQVLGDLPARRIMAAALLSAALLGSAGQHKGWRDQGAWRLSGRGGHHFRWRCREQLINVAVRQGASGALDLTVADLALSFQDVSLSQSGGISARLSSSTITAQVVQLGEESWIFWDGFVFLLTPDLAIHGRALGQGQCALRAPMPGKVQALLVKQGDSVASQQVLLVLEAMKMQHSLRSPQAGRVEAVHIHTGDQVKGEDVLIEIEPEGGGA